MSTTDLERLSYAPRLQRAGPPGFEQLDSDPVTFQAAVLFADISGFTPLATRLAARGPAGVEELSRVLNRFFGTLLELVDAFGGEQVKFAGDALYAVWSVHERNVAQVRHAATACAVAIRSALDGFDAGDGAQLTVRVAVAAGEATAFDVRGADERYFVIAGPVMNEAFRAAEQAQRGQAVVTSAVWASVSANAVGVPLDAAHWVVESVAVTAAPRGLEPAGAYTPASTHATRFADYVPMPIRARLDAGHSQWLAELRRITVLFCQVTGLDHTAPDAPAVLRTLGERASELIRRHDGFLKEIVIDDKGVVLVAIFGVPPRAHEDDAVRGVRSALALHALMAELGLACGIGITTGRCFCGTAGSDVRREYAVIGETMNLSARLMSAAAVHGEAQGILCDDATHRLSMARVDFVSLLAIAVKGAAEPVHVFAPSVFRASASRSYAAMVGRPEERAIVTRSIGDVTQQSRGSTLLIVGEAGIGKTRLLDVADEEATDSGAAVLRGGADPIESATPYFVWRRVFEQLLDLTDVTDRVQRRARVARVLGDALLERAPLMEAVLPLGFEETTLTATLSGATRAAATQELLVSLLAQATSATPSVVLLEDGHWFDGASWALALAVQRRQLPLMLVITTRPLPDAILPEMQALTRDSACTLVTLGPLDDTDALTLAQRQLGIDAFPDSIAQLILTRSAGHPFFATELAQALRDSGVLEIDGSRCTLAPGVDPTVLSLPGTVQGVITSRIDRLPPQEQLAIKVASVVGASFTEPTVRAVHPVPQDVAQLHDYLLSLVRADLTLLESPPASVAFAFKHAITRDVAYDLMLFAQRRQLHRSIAEWYEQSFTDERPELLALLAYHWTRAEVIPKAVMYLERSAVRTFSIGLGKASVDIGLDAARLLGVELPTSRDEILPLLGAEFGKIQSLLAGRTPDALLSMDGLQEENANAVIGLLLRIMPFAHQSQQSELFALMALRCMSMTLERGNGPAAPVVYAMYAIVYRGITGDARTAYGFTSMAKSLDARNGRYLFAPVSFIHTWFVQHWLHPVSDGLEESLAAAERGLEVGDVVYGCFNLAAHVVYLASAGTALPTVMQVASSHLARNAGRVYNAAFHCVHELQFAKALAGRTIDRTCMSDADHDEARDVASICHSDNFNQIGFYHTSRVRLHLYYREYDAAIASAETALAFLPAFAGQVGEWELVFSRALALLGRAGNRRAASQDHADATLGATDVVDAEACVQRLREWCALSTANFEHKLALAEAELYRVTDRWDDAAPRYADAARAASRDGFVQHEALARELFAHALLERGDEGWRAQAASARDAYVRWGAHAKVADIDARFGA